MKQIILVIFVLAAVSPATADRRVQLRDSAFLLKKPHSVAGVTKAVQAALTKKNWTIVKTTGATIEASFLIRTHRVDVLIECSKDEVKTIYVNSQNLMYKKKKDGTEYIHGRYYAWLRYLKREIKLYLSEPI